MRTQRWSSADRRAFADQRLRAQTIPGRRSDGPSADEWDEESLNDVADLP